jgi:flagellar hook-associated protein 3 FlgL
MRISTAQMQLSGTNAMLDRFNEVARTQQELATGKRILKPSDDPVGITQILPLREIISLNGQYNKNSNSAEARLMLEDTTLDSFTNTLSRISELAVQAVNDTLSATDRNAIAAEVTQNLATLMGLANTKDGNGEYIFAGNNTNTLPFTESPAGTFNYTGDSGQRNLQIGATRQIPVGDDGNSVFMNIAYSGGGTQSIFETIDTFINDLQSNTPSSTVITDLQTAMDNMFTVRAQVGSRLNAIDTTRNLNEELVLQSQKTISEVEDLDIAEAISRLNLQMVGLQASQQTFNRVQNLSLFNYL